MQVIRQLFLFLLLEFQLLNAAVSFGQSNDFEVNYPNYHLIHSSNYILDKNFYFISVLSKNKQALEALQKNKLLSDYCSNKKQLIELHAKDTCKTAFSLLNDLTWQQTDTLNVFGALQQVYEENKKVFDGLINTELKPSGCYFRFNNQSNKDFFLNCWRETFKGINTIISHYGLNEGFRYKSIDSASYDIKADYYESYLKDYFSFIVEDPSATKTFYEPSLTIALELMKANERNEAANYEPLERGENKKAVEQIKKTRFDNYKYSAILVPGEGPELEAVELDPVGRLRCELAAARWRKKLAPFIIVSGSNVHPFHTPFTEALEMKKYLMAIDSIPGSAIIIDPQARHTTTNFRDAGRLMIRYGMPIIKAALCVSTKEQVDYIMDERFDKRNIKELGYVPYRNKKRLGNHEISFNIIPDCLQTDPVDPLDP